MNANYGKLFPSSIEGFVHMAFHHVALATNDVAATHHFYTEAMGFTLVKASIGPTPEGGWAKHVFYETGGNGLIAFWDLHGDYGDVKGAMSRDVGLPEWVNHLAFHAPDNDSIDAAMARWLDLGLDVVDIDHDFCRSVYTTDPNGTMVEWCCDTRAFTEAELEHANRMIHSDKPGEFEPAPTVRFHQGDRSKRPVWGKDQASV